MVTFLKRGLKPRFVLGLTSLEDSLGCPLGKAVGVYWPVLILHDCR